MQKIIVGSIKNATANAELYLNVGWTIDRIVCMPKGTRSFEELIIVLNSQEEKE